MSLGNVLKYGAIGLAADIFAPMLTGGSGKIMGALYGLFTPDARQMDRAYAPERFGAQRPEQSSFADSGLSGVAKIGALLFGATTILPTLVAGLSNGLFGMPNYMPSIWSTPWSPAGLLPMAWNQGLIPNWGWTAGWLT